MINVHDAVFESMSLTCGIKKQDLSNESRLLDLVGDSLDLVGLVLACEERLALGLDYRAVDDLETIGDLIAFLQTKVAGGSP